MHRFLLASASQWALFTVFSLILLPAPHLHAQNIPTEYKTADVTAFLGYADTNTDYSVQHDTGLVFGVDYTRYFRFPVIPSIEARAMLLNGPVVDQHTYLVGPRFQMDFLQRRLHPYVNLLIGEGYMYYHFPPSPGYTQDNSIIEALGAGIDVDVYRNFLIKGDFQNQLWNFGDNFTLSSKSVTIGVAYRIPFKPHLSQQYVH
jgi:hypothetical protein